AEDGIRDATVTGVQTCALPISLVREGLELYQDFANRSGLSGYDIGLRPQGYLFCAREEPTVERQRALVERQRAFGLDDVELLDEIGRASWRERGERWVVSADER